jgi:hypothetical protein
MQIKFGHDSQGAFIAGDEFTGATVYAYPATAMRCRARGEVHTAIHYESICQQIYDRLPTFARW